MNRDEIPEKVREFNRFYLPRMGLLGSHYLGSEYSVTEARIFFEVYQREGCNAAHIASVMKVDKSYLSRILAGHERNGYLKRVSSPQDRRSYRLYLTPKGKQRAEEFIQKSNEEIRAVLGHLSEREQRQLSRALDVVMELLKKGEHTYENRSV